MRSRLLALSGLAALIAGLLAAAPAGSQEPAPPAGAGADAVVWVPTGSFASSSLVRVGRDAAPGAALGGDEVLRLETPAGGRGSAQLAVHAPTGLDDLTVSVGRPRSRHGGTLPAGAVQVRYPEFIPFDSGGVIADPLRELPAVDVEGGSNQPVWFSVDVPADAAPGVYTAAVEIGAAAGGIGEWTLQVVVADVALDAMADRPFILDLWAHPDAVADQTGTQLWSEEHWAAMRPYLRDLAEHGQRVVNVAVTEDPWMVTHEGEWRPQTWSHFASTVEWRWDGQRFDFDFGVFDRYVEESRAAGIGERIHAFAMLQFDHRERFVYTDTRTGERVVEEVDLGDARYREGWGQFLGAFSAHLTEKGWFDDASLGFDERPANEMATVFDVLEDEAPQWLGKIAVAANSLDVQDYADYVSYNYSFLDSVPDEDIARRKAEGKPTLFYTYMNPLRPNTVTASPPVSARVLGWVVAQRDLDGFLRWTYNSWPQDVYDDPSFRYGQGDEYIVYPGADGPVSSIRWETFADGLDDAELLRLYAERHGRDDAVFTRVLDAIDPRAESTPAAWSAMLLGRRAVLDGLRPEGGLEVTVSRPDAEVTPGDVVDLTVTAVATGDRPVPAPRLDLPSQPGWSARVVSGPPPGALLPGEQATWQLQVSVHDDAGAYLYLGGAVTDPAGRLLAGFATDLTVRPPVELTAPPAAAPASSPDATSPVTVTVPVSNASSREQTVELAVSGLGFWQVVTPPTPVTLPPGGTADLSVQLNPGGRTGWTTVDVEVRHGGAAIGGGRVDIVSGGRHVSDWDWASESNGWGPAERDASNGEDQPGDGARMSVGGRQYGKGIGAHAASRIVLDLAGRCSRFQTDIGVDDEVAGGSVRFRVEADGSELYASPVMTGEAAARWVDLDVTGVRTLALVVDDAGNGNGQDHADWAGAWLRCAPD
ncbi:glycoside hydrolase domain-containing protein [Jiangella muralis]|uniref:glycoside hydrolase domain-containing protein n=1 Tax=Jiangella muralis TaxID=702383 RepID=UPI00069D0E05|nr:glycoside hydrolase domain-containing protein [Jiangella muralis]